jgi:hypothetical protein
MMKLLPLEKEKKGESGILVQGKESTSEIVKTCFAVAESLRDAGHPAELDFTGREESSYCWVISVCPGKPFKVKDCKQGRQRNATSPAEILNIIGTK